MGKHAENSIASAIRAFAIIIFIVSLIIAIIAFSDDMTWSIGLIYLLTGFISGLMMLGFSEIIYLLQDISNKPSIRTYAAPERNAYEPPAQAQPPQDAVSVRAQNGGDDSGTQALFPGQSRRAPAGAGFHQDAFLSSISRLDRVSEMFDRVVRVSSVNPNLFSEDILRQLKDCVDVERMYGKGVGKQTFLNKLREYFSMQPGMR